MTGFFLNLEILYEQMVQRGISASLFLQNNELCLKDIQFYTGQEDLQEGLIYLVSQENLNSYPIGEKASLLILSHEEPIHFSLPDVCSYIWVSGEENLFTLFNCVQEIFSYYRDLERKVNQALNSENSLYTIVKIAAKHFQMPLFYHDEFYHILAFSDYNSIEEDIRYNERKSGYVQSVEVINQFRTSQSYKETMNTKGGSLWESDYDNTKAVYANVWVNHIYRGRLVLKQEGREYRKSDLYEISFFAQAISVLVRYRNNILGNVQFLENMMIDAIYDKEPERMAMLKELEVLQWDSFDSYICGVISPLDCDVSKFFLYSICTDIEEKIPGSYACYHKGYIYMLVNLTKGGLDADNLRMKMAYSIREGLMHVGVSNVFQDVYEFPVYLRQAMITLEYSEKHASTIWYNEFRTYALEYWMTEGIGKLSKNSLFPPELLVLKNYDKENGTKLLETLEVYLTSERNSTLTSQILKIHRSTLPYRLKHIQTLTRLNLELHETRLYLMMGFYAIKRL